MTLVTMSELARPQGDLREVNTWFVSVLCCSTKHMCEVMSHLGSVAKELHFSQISSDHRIRFMLHSQILPDCYRNIAEYILHSASLKILCSWNWDPETRTKYIEKMKNRMWRAAFMQYNGWALGLTWKVGYSNKIDKIYRASVITWQNS